MDLYTTTTASVIRRDSQYGDCSLNGLTNRFDTLELIFAGDFFAEDKTEAQAAVQAFADKLGHTNFLVAQDRGQYCWSIKPAAHYLGLQKGAAVNGGNKVLVNGQEMMVHDRVESWEMYNRMSR